MSEVELLDALRALDQAVQRGEIEQAAALMGVFVGALTKAPQRAITPAVIALARACEARVYAAHAKLRGALAQHAVSVRAQVAYGSHP